MLRISLRNIILALYVMLVFFPPNVVRAHPLDEIGEVNVYDQKQNLTISPAKAVLTIDFTFYAIEKIKVWESIDKNRDQKLSTAEKDLWMKLGQESSFILLNGKKHFFSATELIIPDYFDFFEQKPADVKLVFEAAGEFGKENVVEYVYEGKDKSFSEIAFEASGTQGIKVEDVFLGDDKTAEISLTEGNQSDPQVLGIHASDALNAFLDKYIKVDRLPYSVAAAALAASFFIGFLHALTPGHGKAIVAGYLVGEKGNIWHAIQLGGIITVTHTGSVFLLGLLSLFLTEYLVPSEVISWLNTVSGILIIAFGTYLLLTRIGKLKKGKVHNHHHGHDHPHSHEPTLSWKQLLPLGVSGGIVPCIDALAILVVAVSLGKAVFGIILLFVFSLGLATALIAGGAMVVFAKNKAQTKIHKFAKAEKYVSVFSALLVTILGFLILIGVGV